MGGTVSNGFSPCSYCIVTCVGLRIRLKVSSAAHGLLSQPHVAQSNSTVEYIFDVCMVRWLVVIRALMLTPPPIISSSTLYTSGFAVFVFARFMLAFRIAFKVVLRMNFSSQRSE